MKVASKLLVCCYALVKSALSFQLPVHDFGITQTGYPQFFTLEGMHGGILVM
jgi:hypothetical protein